MSTDFTTTIPLGAIDEQQLTQLVDGLAAVTGQPVTLSKVYILSTPCTGTSIMLDNLRDVMLERQAQPSDSKPAPKVKIRRARRILKKAEKQAAEPGKRGPKNYKVIGTGTPISAMVIKRMLADHSISVGTRLSHPTKGTFVVMEPEISGDPLLLVREP